MRHTKKQKQYKSTTWNINRDDEQWCKTIQTEQTLKQHWKQQLYDNSTERRRRRNDGFMIRESKIYWQDKKVWCLTQLVCTLQSKRELDWGMYLHEPEWCLISIQNPHKPKHTWFGGNTLLRNLWERARKASTLIQYR